MEDKDINEIEYRKKVKKLKIFYVIIAIMMTFSWII